MIKIRVRRTDGTFRTIVNSTSLPYAKRKVRDIVATDIDMFFGEFEIHDGHKHIETGTFKNKRIKWIKEGK